MKFKTDENLSDEVAEYFRECEHDAVSVLEEGLGGHNDDRIAEVCLEEDRILVTLDRGFSDIRKYVPSRFPGMIVLRSKLQGRNAILGLIQQLLPSLDGKSLRGRLWIVEPGRIRIYTPLRK